MTAIFICEIGCGRTVPLSLISLTMLAGGDIFRVYTLFYKQLRPQVSAHFLSAITRFEPSMLLKSCLIDMWKFILCAIMYKW